LLIQAAVPSLELETSDLLITMGCGDECPYVAGLRRDDWPLPDPKGQGIESVRQTLLEQESLTSDTPYSKSKMTPAPRNPTPDTT
jgi:hypothetical protein